MLTANATLAIFTMLGISSLAIFWAKRFKLPHTVFLVIIGMFLGVLANIPTFHFLAEFHLTPELLFYLLLPTLIFESAYNINVRRLVEDAPIVLILSIVGLLVSTICIAIPLFYILAFIGFNVPFMITLIFGALISATDPVAVLALFKEFGAPPRLSLVFEGESLFNDATAVALFLVLLEVATFGYHGFDTILTGTISFTSMMVGGVIFGIITGGIFAKIVGLTRENETASITLTIVLAHVTFILAELVSHHLSIGGFELPLSPIIATTTAALLMGNYGRPKIHPRAEEFVEKLWGQLAFFANSLIFLLIGLLFVSGPTLSKEMIIVVVITILVVATARAISIYPVVAMYNAFTITTKRIPLAWQHLLSWGSLRGALAVTMVLLIPETFSVPGWTLEMSVRDFLLSLTIGCISATLFIKAPTMQWVMRRLKLDRLTEIETIEYHEALALIHHEITERLDKYRERGYIEPAVANRIKSNHERAYRDACQNVNELSTVTRDNLALRVLRMYAIGIEKRHLKELYHHNEVNESVYRKLTGKLQLQLESIEAGVLESNMSLHTDNKDVFERMANMLRYFFTEESATDRIENSYMYYRAQTIISRKVLKELVHLHPESADTIFTSEAMTHVTELYTRFKNDSEKKMRTIAEDNPGIALILSERLTGFGVHKIAETILDEIRERELVTPKLAIILSDEIASKRI